MRSDRAAIASALLALSVVCVLPACTRTVAEYALVNREEARTDEFVFLEQLETVPAVTNDDALHALFLLERGEDPYETYEERYEEARRLGWVPLKGEPPPALQSAPVGMVSVAVVRIAGIKGGLTMRLIGPTQRASTRELVYLNVIPDRTAWQALTGPELIEMLGRADRLLLGEPLAEIDESLNRFEAEGGTDLPDSVRDVQQIRQRAPRP
jgi:hypothetical protein